ncbi:alpha/beta hydrolase family protein [Virgisporangium ochraceum]|uniref:Lipase n=1 Tax=Virgisporangium ochraceum TaxID=65505 RepID=A0A8J4A8T8_9ACTN|nr:acetylhydrolase [Virgisporangium ochraceum]GIJ75470.1 lipase [Virgisporangium ochraceum]
MTTTNRRTVLAAAFAAGLTVPLAAATRAEAATRAAAGSRAAATNGPRRLTLPGPTGPFPVGTVPLHLVDRSRPDPVRGPGYHRELMASVWYPARDVTRHPRAPWLGDECWRALLASQDFPTGSTLPPVTAGRLGAPLRRDSDRLPVVVFSHGAHDHRGTHTIIGQELASHGYIVVTVDHTHDAFVEFPDGRRLEPIIVGDHALGAPDFAADVPFLLDRIGDLAAGRNPDADGRRLPDGLRGAPDLRRIGMFGTSKGGTATRLVMESDPRVRAGLALDAPMEPITETDMGRPFMLLTSEYDRTTEPVAIAWSHLTGWKLDMRVDGARHTSNGDYKVLLTQIAPIIGMSDEELFDWVGPIDPARMVRVQRAYPLAFFDLHLRGRRQRLLEGPSRAFPEVRFIP